MSIAVSGSSLQSTLKKGTPDVRSAMHAASQLPGGEPTNVDDANAPMMMMEFSENVNIEKNQQTPN